MRPKIRATLSSVPSLDQPVPASSSIPGTAAVATPRATAETSTRSRNFIDPILLESTRSEAWAREGAARVDGPGGWVEQIFHGAQIGGGSTPGRGKPAPRIGSR